MIVGAVYPASYFLLLGEPTPPTELGRPPYSVRLENPTGASVAAALGALVGVHELRASVSNATTVTLGGTLGVELD